MFIIYGWIVNKPKFANENNKNCSWASEIICVCVPYSQPKLNSTICKYRNRHFPKDSLSCFLHDDIKIFKKKGKNALILLFTFRYPCASGWKTQWLNTCSWISSEQCVMMAGCGVQFVFNLYFQWCHCLNKICNTVCKKCCISGLIELLETVLLTNLLSLVHLWHHLSLFF